MSETPPQAYISKVHLKGYKSIKDLEIDFKPGLNIIIGPNGSGKTNFLEFLHYLNFYEVPSKQPYMGDYTFKDSEKEVRIVQNQYSDVELNELVLIHATNKYLNNELKVESRYKFSNRKIEPVYDLGEDDFVNNYEDLFTSLIIHDNPFKKELASGLKGMINIFEGKDKQTHYHIDIDSVRRDTYLDTEQAIRNIFDYDIEKNKLDIRSEFKQNLQSSTPIKDLKVVDNRINFKEEERGLSFDNLTLAFKVNDRWLLWNELSDGTKRIFYLVSALNAAHQVVFLEEPELGIHPDQLYKLMDFLKEQSKTKQVIITTHSPEVLSILGNDELDRIVVTRYDAEKGTQMHHLSEKQIRKGQIYIEEVGNLSSFWVHSNLEEYETEAQ